MSDLQWNPYSQQDWRQLGGQPPYQGEPYRESDGQPSDPEPTDDHEPPRRRRSRHGVRNILGGIVILAVVGLVVSALTSKGTGASTAASRSSASATSSAAVTTASAAAQPTGPGQIGSYFDVQDGSGDTYRVTLVKVIDPVQSTDQFNTLQHGSRLVAVVFRITALTGSPQGEDADNDATVIGTDGRAYTAVFEDIARYNNFEVGVIHVAQGDTVVGAVTFELPQYVNVGVVRWVASNGYGTAVTWNAGM